MNLFIIIAKMNRLLCHVLETEHICRKALQISNNVELLQAILAKANLKTNFKW